MQFKQLGKSGLYVSRICLGMMTYGSSKWREWILDEKESIPLIKHALELGINFFDTSDFYSQGVSEEVTGRALNKFASREQVVIATKLYLPTGDSPNMGGLSRKHIFHAIDNSLQRLKTDYVDLYQIHRWDYDTPIEETMEALHDVVKMGKVCYLGASSMYAWQFAKAQYTAELHGWTKFISMQNHYNLLAREEEREMIPLCLDMGVGLMPWSPLARGFLTGSRSRDADQLTSRAKADDYARMLYYRDQDYELVERVKAVAAKRSVSPAQIALAWILNKPSVVAPVIGATKMRYIDDAVAAFAISLDEEEQKHLEELSNPEKLAAFGMDNEFRHKNPV